MNGAMNTAALSSFDTLQYVKHLKAANVPEEQAEAQAEALRTALDAALSKHATPLATKGDLAAVLNELALMRKDMEVMRKDMEVMRRDIIIKLGTMLMAGFGLTIALLKLW